MIQSKPTTDEYRNGWERVFKPRSRPKRYVCPCGHTAERDASGIGTRCKVCGATVRRVET